MTDAQIAFALKTATLPRTRRQRARFCAHRARLHIGLTLVGSFETMADSVTPSALPAEPLEAGYTTGSYDDFAAIVARFPQSYVLAITTTPTIAAHAFDCEPGNGVPADCPAWWRLARGAGITVPVIYCPASWTTQVVAAMTAAGIARTEYLIWSAHYGSGMHICGPGTCGFGQADLTQWCSTGYAPVGNADYDLSIVPAGLIGPPAPLPTPPPVPPTPPAPPEDIVISVNYTAGPADTNGTAFSPAFDLPKGTTEVRAVFVRGKRRAATGAGKPTPWASPVDGPPKGQCIIRLDGCQPGDTYTGTASFQ